ncbi:hypothetical protein F0562_007815 [Nyssa sinensis]|uniref:Ty3 transposon capsid-like protein domain-containing protein n=1 Tax=Nyssa sinensis TaxID=561372 RepID=A0A5J5A4Q7_9ASTE|nr:hypothetical protein F0562_007815 [Nyssa sinensis]
MEDRAIHWFRWYEKTHSLRSWREFVGALIARFGDSLFDDVVGQLTKLRQISTGKTYQEKFEELANKTNGLSEEFFVSCFVSGLKDEIKAGVQMFRPKNVSHAMGLAGLQEETIEALAKKNRVYSKSYNSSLPTSSKSMELAPKPMESATVVKKMTQKELEERRMKGLCYGCEEKYFRGHVCKKKELFMIEAEEQEDVFEVVVQEMEKEDVQEELQISVHALSGSLSYKTMRIKGKNLRMEFTAFGKKHVLRGGATVEIQQVEVKAMEKLMQKKPQGIIAQLCSLHSKTAKQKIHSDLDRILEDYADVFKEPKDLPPIKSHGHKMPLKDGDTVVAAADTMLRGRNVILKLLKEHLVQSQRRMKQEADKHRSERVFAVGDWGYLKLQPFKQVSLALRKNAKLASKYFGPFQILQKLGPLPTNWIFHLHQSCIQSSMSPY